MTSFGRPEEMGETKVKFFPPVCTLVIREKQNLLFLPTSLHTQTEKKSICRLQFNKEGTSLRSFTCKCLFVGVR